MKPRFLIYILLVVPAILLLHSCTIEKRHYRNGFYMERNRHATQAVMPTHDKALSESSLMPDEIPVESDTAGEARITQVASLPEADSIAPETVNCRTVNCRTVNGITVNDTATNVVTENRQAPPDEPKTHDEPNRLYTILMAIAFLLVPLCLVGTAFNGLVLLYLVATTPAAGALLFALVLILRRRTLQAIANGATGDRMKLSAHYHRFQLLFYLFFAAAFLLSLGWVMVYTGASLLGAVGAIGVVMFGLSVSTLFLLGMILLLFGIIYLLRWRKDPTGMAKPRKNRPPKDG